MKNLSAIFSILFILFPGKISGQETGMSKDWSVSLSFSPVTTFYYYHPGNEYSEFYSKGVREIIYPSGYNFEISRNLGHGITIGSGFNYKSRPNKNVIDIIGEWTGYTYHEVSTDNRNLYEIPVRLRYRIPQSSNLFNPFVNTGIRGSYFKRYYVGEYSRSDFSGTTTGEIDNHDGKLILFCEIGAGTYLNFSKSVAILVGSNLTYAFSGFGYLEFQAGLNYSFQ